MSWFIKLLFFIGDILILNTSIFVASRLYIVHVPDLDSGYAAYLLIYGNLAWLFLTIVSTPYQINREWPIPKIIKSQIAFILIHMLVISSLNIFFQKDYAPGQIALIYAIFFPSFFFFRIMIFYAKRIFFRGAPSINYILIGKNDLSYKLRKYYMLSRDVKYRFFGYFDYASDRFPLEEVQACCAEKDIHEIYCCTPEIKKKQLSQLVDFGLNSLIKVKLLLPSGTLMDDAVYFAKYDKEPHKGVPTIPLDEIVNQVLKRMFDVIFSFLIIVFILIWAIPLIGLMIVMDSPGPILFTQKRNGKGNKVFRCIKFRTMKTNVEADTRVAVAHDPRITKLGRFLRETSIDELPQFINVFMGTMSVVGPRPHMLKVTKDYEQLIQKFIGRHYIKPGITGLAQCLGYRGDKTSNILKNLGDMENRVKMDLHYIENWSFLLDIKIIFLTVISLLRGRSYT